MHGPFWGHIRQFMIYCSNILIPCKGITISGTKRYSPREIKERKHLRGGCAASMHTARSDAAGYRTGRGEEEVSRDSRVQRQCTLVAVIVFIIVIIYSMRQRSTGTASCCHGNMPS
ncbi:hypothetical protein CEXT_483021 [Caerostris extrusa]|uniref:Uncharacterized protein n=1 Tax=Caerostris extrusa TaxID=172846 RepID=A0AAV4U7X5_CAEEX|nr:hypothetical protein CEXT_483021 [Caerostris extrusa]